MKENEEQNIQGTNHSSSHFAKLLVFVILICRTQILKDTGKKHLSAQSEKLVFVVILI